ncbi:hypothetical protein ABBQ38_008673 [Trebouxia sp. C0009 RCD-2024]
MHGTFVESFAGAMFGRGSQLRLAKWCGVQTLRNILMHRGLAARHFELNVPGADAWHFLRTGLPVASWEMPLKGQAWLTPQLPRHYSQSRTSDPVANSEAVKTEFSQAGIPDEVITKVLNQYQYYLRWDIDTKLRPALKVWMKHLGSQQLSARISKYPLLLVRTPEECSDVYLWLASVGIDAEKIQKRAPQVLARQLHQVQNTVWAIQQALQTWTTYRVQLPLQRYKS